jgi:hypothetical protein
MASRRIVSFQTAATRKTDGLRTRTLQGERAILDWPALTPCLHPTLPHPTLDTNTENFHVQAQERALIFGQSSCTAGFAYLRISSCSCWFGELG